MSTASHALLDNLNDPERFRALDPQNMMGLVLKFPQQCREAIAIDFSPGQERQMNSEIRQIVLTGLGGSAIGGDFARCYLEAYGTVPLIVNRDYTLPNWVGPQTLVIAASYSGNTEETLAAYTAAKAAKAQQAVLTSGGALARLAQEDGVPLALVPGGQPPRSAAGYMFFPLLNLLSQRGLLMHHPADDTEELLAILDELASRFGPDVPAASNPAKQMAADLFGKLTVVYGSQGVRGAVAARWKGQFNENAKQAAFANVLPEQNHIEALAWVLAQKQAQNWAVIFLRDPSEVTEMPRIARRVEISKKIVGEATQVQEVWAEGRSLLARMFSLIYFADFLTVYLAYLNGICPTDMALLDYLKAEMAKLG